MPNVVRGERMAGLLAYLAGPGRANEHTEPHLVAGDAALLAWHDDNELGRASALAVARHLDGPRRVYGVAVPGGHVWHCSLSLRAEEGQLTDGQWRAVGEEFIARMGFGDQEGSRAPCRWAAVRHGLSKNGNDHVHLVVDLVREDGTKASVHNDFRRAQQAARAIEAAHGLQVLESAQAGRAGRGYDPAERPAAARRRARGKFEQDRRTGDGRRSWEGLPSAEREGLARAEETADQPRHALARRVRGCAAAAADEAEFVRRMRRSGLLVRARFADGRADVVTGYSVAGRPVAGERPIWYGGGHLARDLTLPRLRADWPDSPQQASAAVAEWTAARRARRPAAPGREAREPDPGMWQTAGRELEQLREQLRTVPLDDHDTWARAARQASGAFAAWSGRVEPVPGPLAATADALARSAQYKSGPIRPQRAPGGSASGAALLLASAARGGQGATAQLVLLRQLANLAKAVHDMHIAAGQARQAGHIEAAVRGQLAQVAARLEAAQRGQQAAALARQHPDAAAAVARARQGMPPAGTSNRSPVPAELTAARPPATASGPVRPGDRRRGGEDEKGR